MFVWWRCRSVRVSSIKKYFGIATPPCSAGSCAFLSQGDARLSDVGELTEEEQRAFEERPTLLAAAQRCNHYVAEDYLPVYVENVKVRACVRCDWRVRSRGIDLLCAYRYCGVT